MSQNVENFNKSQLNLIRTSENVPTDLNTTLPYPGDYIRLTLFESNRYAGYQFFSNKQYEGDPEIKIYEDINGISVKPNEVLEQNYVSEGNYTLQFDFLRNIFSAFNDGSNLQYADGKFVITEISPSRKEIRLIGRNYDTVPITFDSQFQATFNSEVGTLNTIDDGYKDYTFDWVVTFDEGINIPIVNTTFDDISSDEVSLIIRLNKPIPTSVEKLTSVGVEKEVVTTQTQEIFYVSNIKTQTIGSSLTVDVDSWDGEYTPSIDYEENYEELVQSSSFTEMDLQKIESEQNSDINLNIDYSEFKNHAFFGSAVTKLENFKTKVVKIENYLNEVSKSLNVTGSLTGSYIPQKRKTAFDNISNVIKSFTPYERWLYYDNQSQTTASAPGIGSNYAFSTPVKIDNSQENKILSNYDGFKVVYKHTDSGSDSENDPAQWVDITTGMYMVHEAPFYNYSGSVYLSFLMKGDAWINNAAKTSVGKLTINNGVSNANGYDMDFKLPYGAYHSSSVLEPSLTGSKYQRFIFKASQSYWRPSGSATGSHGDGIIQYVSEIEQDSDGNGPHWLNNSYWQILSSSVQIASASMTASSHPIVLNDSYNELGTHYTASDIPFTGSVLPAGELFRIHWYSHESSSQTSSFMTDVKVTLNNPLNAKPFGQLYSTASSEWQNWYNGMYSSASVYDSFNINSLKENLPEKILSGSPDVLPFIDMWGEHFDGIRNYIDNYKTFYNRGYEEYDSVPNNLLPILADNLGWELINPFTGSLSTYFNSVSGSTENIQNLTNNTWLKLLNNLIYIYKSKGTMASVRALLNVYGYPPELISLRQYGGASADQNPRFIDDTPTTTLSGLGGLAGNVSFYSEPKATWVHNFNNAVYPTTKASHKMVKLRWMTDEKLKSGSGIEFNMVPNTFSGSGGTPYMKVVGSGDMHTAKQPWAIYLENSASSNTKGKMTFVIANKEPKTTAHFSFPGGSKAVSCSTDWFDFGHGKLFNVSLYEMTKSANMTNYTQSYEIRVARKEDDKIVLYTTGTLNTVTQSVVDNFRATGSVGYNHNLQFGNIYQGQIFDIRLWSCALSHSKQKQHTLNPFSVVGNSVNSTEDGGELIYRFRLNEGYDSGSVSGSSNYYDAIPNSYADYTQTMSFNATDFTYTKKIINVTKFSPRTDGVGQRNDNFLLSDVPKTMVGNLDPVESVFKSNTDIYSDDNISISRDIEFSKSPSDVYDDYISDIMPDKDLTQYFSKWEDLYEPTYADLDALRNKIFANISVNINEYIEAQANLFNPFILEAIQNLLPAQTNFVAGIVLKQNLLERTKIKYHPATLKEYEIYKANLTDFYDLNSSLIPEIYEDTIDFTNEYHNLTGQTYFPLYQNGLFTITDYVGVTSTYELPLLSNEIVDYFNPTGESIDTIDGDMIKTNYYVINGEFLTPYEATLNRAMPPLEKHITNASGEIDLETSDVAVLHGNYIDVTDYEGHTERYIFKNGTGTSGVAEGTGTSGVTEGSYTGVVVQINGLGGNMSAITLQLFSAIQGYQGVGGVRAPSPGLGMTVDFGDGEVFMTQGGKGVRGNREITSSLPSDKITLTGFSGGETELVEHPAKTSFVDFTSSEYITPLNLINNLDLKSWLDISGIDTNIYLSNSIQNPKSLIVTVSSPIEETMDIIGDYYDYVASILDVTTSNDITLYDGSGSTNYNIIFQNIYQSNELQIQEWINLTASLYSLVEDSERLNYERDIINYSILFQNIAESNELQIQDWIRYSMSLYTHSEGNIDTELIETPLITLQTIYDARVSQDKNPSKEVTTKEVEYHFGMILSKTNPAEWAGGYFSLRSAKHGGNFIKFIYKNGTGDSGVAEPTGTPNVTENGHTGIVIQLQGNSNVTDYIVDHISALHMFEGSLTTDINYRRQAADVWNVYWQNVGTGEWRLKVTGGGASLNSQTTEAMIIGKLGGIVGAISQLHGESYWTNDSYTKSLTHLITSEHISEINSNEWTIYDGDIPFEITMVDDLLNGPLFHGLEWPYIGPTLNGEYVGVLDINNPLNYPYDEINSSIIEPLTQTITHLAEQYNTQYENIHQNWGTGSNNTHFINWNNSGTLGDYNTEYHSSQIWYNVIGDFQQVSESRVPVSCSSPDGMTFYEVTPDTMPCYSDWHCEATDYRCHHGERVIQDEVSLRKNMVYESVMVAGAQVPFSKKGRVLGKTAFIYTGSDGQILYPSNHWRHYHTAKDQMENLYYGRTKYYAETLDSNGNILPNQPIYRGQFMNGKDSYPNEQVYGMKIEGSDTDNVLRVERPGDRFTSGSNSSQQKKR